ncbi:MAG TPA: MFS transporter [bacterium]|nr:MFS transporter [bacterium]
MNALRAAAWRSIPRPDRSNAGMWAIGAGHGMTHAYSAAFYVLLPFLAKDLGLSYSQVGLIISLRQLMSTLINLPAGAVVDTIGRRSLFMSAALAWASLPYLVVGLTKSYTAILLAVGVVGAGSFLWHPAAITALSEMYPLRRGYGLALHELGANLGDTLTPLAAGLLLAAFNWRQVMLIVVAAGLLLTLVITRVMSHAHRRHGGAPARALPIRDYVAGLALLARNARLLALAMISGVRSMTQLGLSTFLPLYLLNVQHLPAALIGLYLAVVQGSGMIATPIAGTLSDRLGPKRVATIGMFSTSVALLGFAALNLGPAFVAALAVLGFFTYSMRPAIFRWAIAVVPREYEGTAVGILFTTQALLPTAIPIIGGYLGDRYGLLSIFYVIAATVLVANAALLFVPDAKRPAAQAAPGVKALDREAGP